MALSSLGATAPGAAVAAVDPSGEAPRADAPSARVGLGPVEVPDPRAAARADLATLDAVVDGRIPVTEGLRRIAMSGGLPIVANGRTVFVSDAPHATAVAGDATGWRPTPMARRGPVQVLELPGELRGGYKLAGPDGGLAADPWSRAYAHDEHGEISLVRPRGAHLARFPLMGGFGLAPRTVRVRVPAEPATHHLYMQDGQNLFDPGAMHGGWRADEAAGPRTLVIGVDNTGLGRMAEYTHARDVIDGAPMGGRLDDYADLLTQVVQPHIEATYGRPRRVGVLGSSLGGLAAFGVAARYPKRFDFVGAMSGTFGWGRMGEGAAGETMIDRFRGQPRRRRPRFYLDSGGRPGGGDNYDVTQQMKDALADTGYRFGRELWHWHEPDAPHSEAAWAARLFRPLAIFEAM